jgi:hypothetical protein
VFKTFDIRNYWIDDREELQPSYRAEVPCRDRHISYAVLADDIGRVDDDQWLMAGVDWLAALRRAFRPDNIDYFGLKAYSYLGHVTDLLPSGKLYTVAQIGEVITPTAAIVDMEYMAALRQAAANYGARLETSETGECIHAVWDLFPCLNVRNVPTVCNPGKTKDTD